MQSVFLSRVSTVVEQLRRARLRRASRILVACLVVHLASKDRFLSRIDAGQMRFSTRQTRLLRLREQPMRMIGTYRMDHLES
jgi:hypothetical protein